MYVLSSIRCKSHLMILILCCYRILPFTALLVLSDFLQVGVSEHTPRDEKKSDLPLTPMGDWLLMCQLI